MKIRAEIEWNEKLKANHMCIVRIDGAMYLYNE